MTMIVSLIHEGSQEWSEPCCVRRQFLLPPPTHRNSTERIEGNDRLLERFGKELHKDLARVGVAYPNDPIDTPASRLTARGDHRAAHFAEQSSSLSFRLGVARQSHGPQETHVAVDEHRQVCVFAHRMDQHHRFVAAIPFAAAPQRGHREGPEHDAGWLRLPRLTHLGYLSERCSGNSSGEHRRLRLGAFEFDKVERRIFRQRRELALSLETHHVGQVVRFGCRQRENAQFDGAAPKCH